MNRLKELRLEKKLSQLQMQQYFAIDQSEYSKIERGLRDPTMQQAIDFANFFKTSIDYIMGMTNKREAYPKKENEVKK